MSVRHSYRSPSGSPVDVEIEGYPEACPWCERAVDFERISTLGKSLETDEGYSAGTVVQIVLRCIHSSCGYFSIAEYYLSPNDNEEVDPFRLHMTYPCRTLAGIADLVDDEGVPRDVIDSLKEANHCFHAHMYQSFGAMARRAVHAICQDKKAKGRDLYKQIESLRQQKVLTDQAADCANEIRTVGKHGAHPEWELVSEEMAHNIMQHLLWLIRSVYLSAPDLRYRHSERRRDALSPRFDEFGV